MKILVFENEIPAVSEAFEDLNNLDFGNSLEVTYVDKSQNFRDFRSVGQFDIVFVDIDLSSNSEKDGYGIIKDLKDNDFNNIVVLTGNDVKDELQRKGWESISIVSKPIFLDELKATIEKF